MGEMAETRKDKQQRIRNSKLQLEDSVTFKCLSIFINTKTVVHLQPGEKIRHIHGTRCRFENHTVVGQLTIVTTNGATYG